MKPNPNTVRPDCLFFSVLSLFQHRRHPSGWGGVFVFRASLERAHHFYQAGRTTLTAASNQAPYIPSTAPIV